MILYMSIYCRHYICTTRLGRICRKLIENQHRGTKIGLHVSKLSGQLLSPFSQILPRLLRDLDYEKKMDLRWA
jgi:hypothetical protein